MQVDTNLEQIDNGLLKGLMSNSFALIGNVSDLQDVVSLGCAED